MTWLCPARTAAASACAASPGRRARPCRCRRACAANCSPRSPPRRHPHHTDPTTKEHRHDRRHAHPQHDRADAAGHPPGRRASTGCGPGPAPDRPVGAPRLPGDSVAARGVGRPHHPGGEPMDYVDYDAIIVGARVAGSSLAILLGRQGKRVLLVDRDRFPSDTLSTHLLQPPAVEMLDRLGVLAEVESSGLRRLGRLRTYLGDVIVEGPLRAPGAYALCARRDRLDVALIDEALRHDGVEMLEGTSVDGLLWEDGRVSGVELRTAGGERRAVSARVVVGADGKYSRVAEWAGAARYDEAPAMRPIYYAYYRGVTPQPEPALEVFYQEGRIGFLLPMEPGIDCLVLEIQPEEFPAFRAGAEGRLDAAFRALPGMATRMAGAERDGPARGTRGVENYLRAPYGPGWALTGDAAFCKDPSTGTGIEDAFRQSFLLAGPLGAV